MSITIVEFSTDATADDSPQQIDQSGKIFIQKMHPTSQDTEFLEDLNNGRDTFGVQLSKSVKTGYQWEIPIGDGMEVIAVKVIQFHFLSQTF